MCVQPGGVLAHSQKSMKSAACVVCFFVIFHSGIALKEQCSVLGKELIGQSRTFYQDTSDSDSTQFAPHYTGQLVDFAAPANCTGKGIAWNFCFYIDFTSSITVQRALLFVYRKTGNDTYLKVNGSELTMNVYDQYTTEQRYCERVNLTTPVDILKGDLIGVCLPDQRYAQPLDMFEDYNGYQLHHLNTGHVLPDCSDVEVTSIDISVGNWEVTNDLTLNVNLEIIPTDPATSSLLLTPTSSLKGMTSSSSSLQLASSVAVNTTEEELDSGGSPSSLSLESIVGITVGGVLALLALPLCLLAAAFCVSKRRRQASQSGQRKVMVTNLQYRRSLGETRDAPYVNAELHLKKLEETQLKDTSHYAKPENVFHRLFEQLQRFNITIIPPEKIKVTKPLGQGHFGRVNRGLWQDSIGMFYEVAVKTSIPEPSDPVKIKLLREATVMVQFKHPNIIQLYGVVVQENKVMLVLELAKNGDLKNYLKGLRNTSQLTVSSEMSQEFLKFSKDVAMGMYYLSRKGFVHRDIAARNMFLTATKMCKVGDFGMSRDVAEDIYYVSRGGDVPVRWTAPEALELQKYSTATDIWSYGCLLYEIIPKVKSGYRMSRPASCPQEVYELMSQCWHPDPHCRPTFREVLMSLLAFEESTWHQDRGNPPQACTSFTAEPVGWLRNAGGGEELVYSELGLRSGSAATKNIQDMEEIYDDMSSRVNIINNEVLC